MLAAGRAPPDDPRLEGYYQPALRLSPHDAQQLMDELWHCGLRPTEGVGSAGSLAATQAHMADMRTIAMAALKRLGVE